MNKVIVLLVTVIFSMSMSHAGSNPTLSQEISQKVNIDLSTIKLNEYEEDYVQVKFKIYDGLIQIVKIDASQLELMELIINELKEIHIRTPYSETEIHNFNFTFKKK